LFNNFKIAETEGYLEQIKKPEFKKIYEKIKSFVYPALKTNPYFSSHIKKLKGKYSEIYRYRVGDYRLFYTVDKEKVIIFIVSLIHRKDAYR
jgi:mRNA interferase RelE/StbE